MKRSPGEPTSSAQLPLRPVEFLVLAVLGEAPRHGYGIVQAVETLTGGAVRLRPGDVYRVLFRLESRGLLAVDGRVRATARGASRTTYRITEAGRRVARAEASLMATVAGRVLQGESS